MYPSSQPDHFPSHTGPLNSLGSTSQNDISKAPFTSTQRQQSGPGSSPIIQAFPSVASNAPPQLPPAQGGSPLYGQAPTSLGAPQYNHSNTSLPALRPVFGVSLDDLLKRDGSAVPLVVYQCIQAVDLFGLEVEGIYRLSGSSIHVSKLKGVFDNGQFFLISINSG